MKAIDTVRRRPRQTRSESTVRLIYKATSRIIEREGAERLTTKRIAEVSGFSIGTLYQYFRDRDSLLMAMAAAHRDRLIERLEAALAASRDHSCREAVSRLVAVVVADARYNRKTLRAVISAVTQKDMVEKMRETMRVLDDYIGHRLAELAAADGVVLSVASQFVLSRSLTGVLCAASMEDARLLDSDDIERQLRNMLVSAMIREPECHDTASVHDARPTQVKKA